MSDWRDTSNGWTNTYKSPVAMRKLKRHIFKVRPDLDSPSILTLLLKNDFNPKAELTLGYGFHNNQAGWVVQEKI